MSTSPNPYVGPRTFTETEAPYFFGRDREARDLTARIVSERLLLFYAQSGAGKSSLLNARIIPNLRDQEGFQVLPVGRVSGDLPTGLDAVANIFAFNLVSSLDQSGEHPARLARVSLTDFLAYLVREPAVGVEGRQTVQWVYRPDIVVPSLVEDATPVTGPRFVLIIDQFEEIITSHPERWKEREAFFQQLNQALLDDPNLWVVLTLREDYVAALDPYAEFCFNRLRARFYMERMKVDTALEAISRPAEKGGRPFEPGAAEQLAGNLSQVRLPGQVETVAGQYVEPVQLQVVCYQLWENIKDRPAGVIAPDDLEEAGDVDQALTKFYEESLASALAHPALAGVSERQLRAWFSEELITDAGTRATVFRNEVSGYTGSVPNALIGVLEKQFLLRTELRAGGAWVELVHDRLVRPVSDSNARWAEQRLSALQRRAAIWQQEGRPDEMLLKGDSLREAERWAEVQASEMEAYERDFLAISQQERSKAAYAARQARRLRILAISATVLSILAIVAAVLAWKQYDEADKARETARLAEQDALAEANAAERAEKKAQTEALGGAAIFELSRRRFDVASLMALAAGEQAEGLNDDSSLAAHAIRRTFDLTLPGKRLSRESNRTGLAGWLQSGTQQLLATGDTITILDTLSGEVAKEFLIPDRRMQAVDASRQRILVTGTVPDLDQGLIEMWSIEKEAVTAVFSGHSKQVHSAAWSPDGTKIVSGSDDQTARVWSLETGHELHRLSGHSGPVWTVAWSPDGTLVFTGAWDGTSRLWSATTGDLIATLRSPHKRVGAVGWSSHDDTVYIGHDDATIEAWNTTTQSVLTLPSIHTDRIQAIAERPEVSDQVLSIGSDGLAVLWDVRIPAKQMSWYACTSPGYSIDWHPDGNSVLIGCEDGTIRVWNLQQHPDRWIFKNHLDWVWGVSWSPDGTRIATSGQDKRIRIWSATTGEEIAKSSDLFGDHAQATDVAWRPDNEELLSGHYDGVARIWHADSGMKLAEFTGGHRGGSQGGIWAIAWNSIGTRFATGGGDGRVLIWERDKEEEAPIQIAQLLSRISAVAWSPDDRFLAYGGDDGNVRISATESESHTVELNVAGSTEKNQRLVSSVAWHSSRNGSEIAVGLSDGFLQIWNPETRAVLHEMQVATGGVEDVAWSPNGTMLATGSWDGTTRVWDTTTWKETTELEGHDGVVQGIDWSPDGSRIVTGSRDKTARVWIVGNDLLRAELLRRVCTGAVITESDIKAMIPDWTSCSQRLAEPETVRLLTRFDNIVTDQP